MTSTQKDAADAAGFGPTVEVTESPEATVGSQRVRRALPYRARRTVGAWCFVHHMGPASPELSAEVGVGPHPHIGLQTVTWLIDGELRHRDSLGSDQVIRPGQLNLMTAGSGIAHAEEATAYRGRFEGVQLWVAQPEATRHGANAFEHHGELPVVEAGPSTATVLVGSLAGARSGARRDTDHFGADLLLRPGTTVLPLDPAHELALVVIDGAVSVASGGSGPAGPTEAGPSGAGGAGGTGGPGGEVDEGATVLPGHLAYLGSGRDELALRATENARAVLIGGVPFESPVVMWWNFVGRSGDEIKAAATAWNDPADDRFGGVASSLDPIPAPNGPWPTSRR